jgi:hypothetical protein
MKKKTDAMVGAVDWSSMRMHSAPCDCLHDKNWDAKYKKTDAKPTHTPGPWHWNGERFIGEDGSEVLCGKKTNVLRNRQEANARLIAAAPDLLAALRRANEMLDACDIDKEVREDMFAAIAKAEGIWE